MIARRETRLLVPAALLIACAGLGWIIVEELRAAPSWRGLDPAPPSSEPIQAPRSVAEFSMPPSDTFAAIVERPIFSRSRSPLAEGEDPEPEVGPGLNATLIGTIISSDQEIALVVPKGSSKFVRLSRGDRLQGWILESIKSDRVTFTRDGVEAQIELSYDQPPPPRTRPRTAPARKAPKKVPPSSPSLRKPADSDG